MIVSTKIETWAKGFLAKSLFVVNPFAMQLFLPQTEEEEKNKVPKVPNGDFVEWDLTDPKNPVLEVRMTQDGDNKTFARCFPSKVISMFGRWETLLIDKLPRLPGKRGQGKMRTPKFDLNPVRALTGYPCLVKDIPTTLVTGSCVIPKHMNVNKLLDFYFEWMENAKGDINNLISANASKLLNLQIQMGCGAINDPKQHANGWSGAELLFTATIQGRKVKVGYKHEQANENDFPFISLDMYGDEVELHIIIIWLLKNWARIEKACAKKNLDLFGCTLEKLLESATCGPHFGNEVLGYAVGKIPWKNMDFVIGENANVTRGIGGAKPASPAKPTDNAAAPVKQAPSDGSKERKRTKCLSFAGINKMGQLPGSINPDGKNAGSVTHKGDNPSVADCTGTWGSLIITSLVSGKTDFEWTDYNGNLWVTEIEVAY